MHFFCRVCSIDARIESAVYYNTDVKCEHSQDDQGEAETSSVKVRPLALRGLAFLGAPWAGTSAAGWHAYMHDDVACHPA